jgi:hypothetical protein
MKCKSARLKQGVNVIASISSKNCGSELLPKCAVDAFDYCVGRRIFDCGGFAFDAVAVQHLLELTTHDFGTVIVYNLVRSRVTA